MSVEKNPYKLSSIDLKLGVTMRECAICGFRFHILPKRKTNFKNRGNEPEEPNDLCLTCIIGGKK